MNESQSLLNYTPVLGREKCPKARGGRQCDTALAKQAQYLTHSRDSQALNLTDAQKCLWNPDELRKFQMILDRPKSYNR